MGGTQPAWRVTRSRSRASLLLFSLLVSWGGCSLPVKHGSTTHFFVLGFGIVSVNTNNSAACVTRMQNLGAYVAADPAFKIGVGLSSYTSVSVVTNAEDVRIEVRSSPLGRV